MEIINFPSYAQAIFLRKRNFRTCTSQDIFSIHDPIGLMWICFYCSWGITIVDISIYTFFSIVQSREPAFLNSFTLKGFQRKPFIIELYGIVYFCHSTRNEIKMFFKAPVALYHGMTPIKKRRDKWRCNFHNSLRWLWSSFQMGVTTWKWYVGWPTYDHIFTFLWLVMCAPSKYYNK